jgi:hypothetical protein
MSDKEDKKKEKYETKKLSFENGLWYPKKRWDNRDISELNQQKKQYKSSELFMNTL